MSLPFVRLVLQHGRGDCGIASLAMLLGQTYEDVFAAAVSRRCPKPHTSGMLTRQLQATAKALGARLMLKRTWDADTDEGLLTVERTAPKPDEFAQHLVVLKFGLVFDTDGEVWEPETYYAQHGFRPVSLLTVEA